MAVDRLTQLSVWRIHVSAVDRNDGPIDNGLLHLFSAADAITVAITNPMG